MASAPATAKQLTYRAQLQDPRWQARRLEVLQAADFRCSRCRKQKPNLQAHHTRYITGRDPWDYPDELLVVLCGDCHELQHLPPSTADDLMREQNIERLNEQLTTTKDPRELREIMAAIEALVRARSPEQVRRIERDRGLR